MTPMREDDLLRGVLDLCRVHRWRTIHLRPAVTAKGWRTPVQGDGIGFPDVLAVRGDRIVAAELKVRGRNVTDAQASWLAALDGAGVEVFVWDETQYPDGIERHLR